MALRISKNTLLSSTGAMLEYYDFVVYGMMLDILNKLFFDGRIINSYVSFALGYLVRPFGGLIFGLIADTYGRKVSMNISVLFVAMSTLLMGCIYPGEWACCLILILRVLQGISFASEMPNAITMSIESDENKANHSFVISASAIGSVSASLMCFYVFRIFSFDEVMEFGWRMPFIFGGCMSLIFFFARRFISESPEFRMDCSTHNRSKLIFMKLKTLIRMYDKVLFSIFIMLLPAVMIIINLHIPAFAQEFLMMDRASVHMYSLIGIVVMIGLNPVIGELFEYFKSAPFFVLLASFAVCVFAFQSKNLLVFFIFYQLIISTSMIKFSSIIHRIFPTAFRVTAFSFAYNISFIIAGFSPIILRKIIV
ncbi:MFS transporter [Candidatus Gromoviella agglomerans]|uniref:MFS transporter n=1 Tax=Candidatus Gromoviella agglomerans TaxID=2806609 RepID=UPI001E610A9D|nr:MFS transporter [Candidatus Gromoviella agglomerans]UFX98129.1 MFS transporter domain protein [Candidatus Gromoviella agglomerans]